MARKRIAITLDSAIVKQLKDQVRAGRAGSVSAFIASAVSARLESDALAQHLDELRAAHRRRTSPRAT